MWENDRKSHIIFPPKKHRLAVRKKSIFCVELASIITLVLYVVVWAIMKGTKTDRRRGKKGFINFLFLVRRDRGNEGHAFGKQWHVRCP